MSFIGRIAGLFAAATLASAALPAAANADELEARIVDVGNALCVIIKAPGNGFMLYDAGDRVGNQCLTAVSKLIGDRRINLIVISHSDADHIGELDDILKAYGPRVEKLVYTGRFNPSETFDRAAKEIANLDVDQTDTIGVVRNLGDATVTFVAGWQSWPDLNGPYKNDDSALENVVSVVVRVEYAGQSILLTGDTLGRTGKHSDTYDTCIGSEDWMVRNAASLIDAEILIGQHHGGDNSSSTCFIKAVSPRYVVFSAGHVDRYKHPRLSTAQRFTGYGMPGGVMYVPGGRMFSTDRGDDQGKLEWSPLRIPECKDDRGDDDVEVFLSDQPGVAARVRYRTPNGKCAP